MKNLLLSLTLLVTPAALAATATYEVTIQSNWNLNDHLAVPGPAHFSPVTAVSYNSDYTLLPIGGQAGPGLESLAEMGRTPTIEQEINEAGDAIGKLVVTENQFITPMPTQTFEIEVSEKAPYLSFVSMIAPSPDWVIGINSLQLYNPDTGFSEGAERDLFAIDAGTEGGDTGGNFGLNNPETSPQGLIGELTGNGFNAPFAKVTIRKLN